MCVLQQLVTLRCAVVCAQVIDSVKQTHPQLPIILYISGSGGLLERMAAANPDIISIDQSVDIVDGIKRVGSGFAIQVGDWQHWWAIGGAANDYLGQVNSPYQLNHKLTRLALPYKT